MRIQTCFSDSSNTLEKIIYLFKNFLYFDLHRIASLANNF